MVVGCLYVDNLSHLLCLLSLMQILDISCSLMTQTKGPSGKRDHFLCFAGVLVPDNEDVGQNNMQGWIYDLTTTI